MTSYNLLIVIIIT